MEYNNKHDELKGEYPEIFERLIAWTDVKCEVMHYWEDNSTFYVIVKRPHRINFFRLFYLGNDIKISADNSVYLEQ